MKSYFVLILTIFSFFQNFGQDFQMPNMPTKELERGGNLQNSSIADSLLAILVIKVRSSIKIQMLKLRITC